MATRRNDRRLTTTTGEPVRNRDTWTVTAIHADGSITVSHQGGHGDVTLPADYVREHVRLGYAATEHGWQSDTVDTAIALTSPATTRRGLYVAATRGRDEQHALRRHRQRRRRRSPRRPRGASSPSTAPTSPHRPSAAPSPNKLDTTSQQQRPTARCAIPEWFPPLLADARAEVARLEQQEAERQRQRERLEAAAAFADCTYRTVERDTAPDRDRTLDRERRVDEARRDHAAAQRQLDASPRRSRRAARRDARRGPTPARPGRQLRRRGP